MLLRECWENDNFPSHFVKRFAQVEKCVREQYLTIRNVEKTLIYFFWQRQRKAKANFVAIKFKDFSS